MIYKLGQFSPGLVPQAWPKTQNQDETAKKPPALVQTDLLPPNFGHFSHINENTKRKNRCSSQRHPNHALRGFTEVCIWLETFAFGQILLRVRDVTVS